MGRPSKLSSKQWEEILKRNLDGESIRALGREFKVSESTIRERISAQSAQIKNVVNQIVRTDMALRELPLSAQITAHNLADKLKNISVHLAGAAEYGAMTAHRLNMIANQQVGRIDETAPLENNVESLKSIMAMTRGANDAAQTGLNLLNANKEVVNKLNEVPNEHDEIRTIRLVAPKI